MILKYRLLWQGLFAFLFFQNIFCRYNDYSSSVCDDDVEYTLNPTSNVSVPTPMEIERGSDFVYYEEEACATEVVIDKDGDVVMKENAQQNVLKYWQKKLLSWIFLYASVQTNNVDKHRLFDWLLDNWELIKQNRLDDWFLELLRQLGIEELLAVWEEFISK